MDQKLIQRIRSHYEGDAGRRWQRIEEERPKGYLEQNIVIGRRRLHDQLLSWLAAEGHVRVLDAGCGLGTLTAKIGDAGIAVTGIDLVPGFIDTARRRTAPDGPTFVGGDLVQRLADDAESPPFDAVVLAEVLEDYDSGERFELLKALAQSGTPRVYVAFRSSGFGSGGLWSHLAADHEREVSEIELLRGVHLATPFRQRRQAKINVRNYRVHLSDLHREN